MDYSFEPEIEKLNVSCIINGVVDSAVLELQEDNDCLIILTVGNNTYSSGAEHFWGALTELRKQLEEHNIKLLCQGCCMNVYPSPMILDMGDARKAYKMKLGYTAKMEDLVFIFDPCDPDDYASIEEQDRFYDEWKRTPRILEKPNDSAKADANLKDEHNTKPKKNWFRFWKHKSAE